MRQFRFVKKIFTLIINIQVCTVLQVFAAVDKLQICFSRRLVQVTPPSHVPDICVDNVPHALSDIVLRLVIDILILLVEVLVCLLILAIILFPALRYVIKVTLLNRGVVLFVSDLVGATHSPLITLALFDLVILDYTVNLSVLSVIHLIETGTSICLGGAFLDNVCICGLVQTLLDLSVLDNV